MSKMSTTPKRARLWLKTGKAVKKFNKLGQFYVQILGVSCVIRDED
jgi:hypothetical protein